MWTLVLWLLHYTVLSPRDEDTALPLTSTLTLKWSFKLCSFCACKIDGNSNNNNNTYVNYFSVTTKIK